MHVKTGAMLKKWRGRQQLRFTRRTALGASTGATEWVQNAKGGCQRHDKKPVDRLGPEESC